MPFDATPTNTTAAVLRRARALIDSPEKWANYAGMDEGKPLCSMGAMRVASQGICHEFDAWSVFTKAIGTKNVPDWNDSHTYAEVLQAFDRAIELAEAEG